MPVEVEVLEMVGKIAGIGGIALGVMLLLFRELIRKSIFPTLKKDDAYRLLKLMVVLVWSVAIAGIGAWAWAEVGAGTSGEISTEGGCSPVIVGTDGNVTVSSDCPNVESGAGQ